MLISNMVKRKTVSQKVESRVILINFTSQNQPAMSQSLPSKTKIIATIGPACSDIRVLRKMFEAGIDVCRLNFSHGSHEEHLSVIRNIRELNRELNSQVAILADLQGPKLRIGRVENNSVLLEDGATIEIVTGECLGTASRVSITYPRFPADVEPGNAILIDDGKLKLEILETNRVDRVLARVIHGGELSSKKGVNLPHTRISLPSLTEKDLADADFVLDQDIDWIALSFVRTVTDVVELREIIKKKKKHTRVISKIEKPEALDEIDNIIDLSDGIMIARGDLGVEVDFDRVPLIQKNIIRKCIDHARPVIIATQMMETMISNFRPTRAEVNDVANAVLDGADALMLSGETSTGKYPVEVIRTMQQIINWTEENGGHYIREHAPAERSTSFLPDSICYNAVKMAQQTRADAIITFTHSGYTAVRISSHRPTTDIFAFTSNRRLLNSLSLLWGVQAYSIEPFDKIDEAIEHTISFLKKEGKIRDDQVVVHVGSTPLIKRGQTNMVKLSYV